MEPAGLTSAQRSEKAYIKAKVKRLKAAEQSHKYDFPNPRKGIVFPEVNVIDFKVVQKGKEIRLMTYRYSPPGNVQPKALFLLFHGLNSSVTHGSHIAKGLADAGYCVLGFDHRGFGGSEGQRGFIENLDVHLADARLFVDKVEQLYGKNIKKFVGGLSMGGMTSYNLTLEQPNRYAGAVLMAPAIKGLMSSFIKGASKFLDALLPQMNLVEQKGTNCNRSIALAEDQKNDPNSYVGKMCGSTTNSILSGMERGEKSFSVYSAPFLIIQGGVDKLVDPDVGYELIEKSQSKDKTHLYYAEMWHDQWHEPEIVEIIPKIIQWADYRV